LDGTFFTLLSRAFLFAGIYCFLWAALIVLGQVVGWLKVGEWQQVVLDAPGGVYLRAE